MADKVLLQTGDFLLLTTGDKLLLQAITNTLSTDAGAYTSTGAPVNFSTQRACTAGSYGVTGYPVTFELSTVLPINPKLLVILPDESRFI